MLNRAHLFFLGVILVFSTREALTSQITPPTELQVLAIVKSLNPRPDHANQFWKFEERNALVLVEALVFRELKKEQSHPYDYGLDKVYVKVPKELAIVDRGIQVILKITPRVDVANHGASDQKITMPSQSGILIQSSVTEPKGVVSNYGKGFGETETAPGSQFKFPDMTLQILYFRDLTADETLRKKKANDLGIDGGDSMLSPAFGFRLTAKEVKEDFELSLLPYDKHRIQIGERWFLLQNQPTKTGGWIIAPQP